MNKIILTCLTVALAASGFATPRGNVMHDILAGEYNATTLSSHEQDSILGNLPEQRYRLECTDKQQVYRHSYYANYIIYDTQKNTRKPLSDNPVRDAIISPNGRYIAFVKSDNNIYMHKLDFGTEVAVTATKPTTWNGIADWLYEEEFGKTCLMQFSPDSKQLAFIRLEDKDVPETSWQLMLGEGHPETVTQSYPRAGERNARASVQIYTISNKDIRQASLPEADDRYIPRIQWRTLPAAKKDQEPVQQLAILTLNRDQNKMEVFACNPASLVCTSLHEESSDDYYVDYSLFDEWQWLSDGRMIVVSEQEGWRKAYLYGNDGIKTRALTQEGIDVTAVYGVNEKTQTLFYQAAPTPSTRHIYALNLKNGTITQVTEEDGMWSAHFAKDCNSSILCHQSFDTPNEYIYLSKDKWSMIENNAEVKAAWQANNLPEPQLLRIPNGKGQELEAMLLYPTAKRSYSESGLTSNSNAVPLVLMHYSGPASQRVLNRWRKRFEYALVEAGYAVLIVDPRGTDCRGRAWRNETYMSLGQKEAEDLIAAARWAAQRPDIDGDRMAILGWSYGGYQTLFTMSQNNHPFKAGVAIAPVTDWKLYDCAYTERYMRRPQVNDRGYDEASLLNKAADLSGSVLIIHGTADDNVHVQQTMQYIDALVRADKQFEMQLYPDDNHFLKKGNNASHMHNRVLLFLQKNL